MGRVRGKVAFITGAARGQGRSHVVRLPAEGADIVAVDVCEDLPTVPYDLGREADLAETAALVEAEGRACTLNMLPVPYIDPIDVSHAVVYLASDESRYVTAAQISVDAGSSER